MTTLAVLLLGSASAYVSDFDEYKAAFGKRYASAAEHAERERHFLASKRRVEAHNARELSWRMGLNQFSDMA